MAKQDSGKSHGQGHSHNTGSHTPETGTFSQQAKDAATAVADQARDAVASATQKGQEALASAKSSAASMQHHAQEAIAAVPGQMKNLAGQIRQQVPQGGTLGTAAHSVAGTLESGATYLQEHDVCDMAKDLEGVVRDHPIPALLAGIGVGFLLGRTLRS